MWRPANAMRQSGDPMDLEHQQFFFYLDGRTVATPAFRIMLWCDGSWRDPENNQGLQAIFDLFARRWKGSIRSLTQVDIDGRWRTQPAGPDSVEHARALIAAPSSGVDRGVRLSGWIDAPHFIEAAPCLRASDVGPLACLSLELPHDAEDLVEITDLVSDIVGGMALRCGLAGYGFFLPNYLDSLGFAFPMGMLRNPPAIEITLRGASECLINCTDADGDLAAVLPDLGWRVLMGPPFKEYMAGLLQENKRCGQVDIRQHEQAISLTAGNAPIWGGIAQGEDISPYQALAKLLKPLRMPEQIAQRHMFVSCDSSPDQPDRLRAYLRRFDP